MLHVVILMSLYEIFLIIIHLERFRSRRFSVLLRLTHKLGTAMSFQTLSVSHKKFTIVFRIIKGLGQKTDYFGQTEHFFT